MPRRPDLLDRIRSYGANAILEGGKLRIVNLAKLPREAIDYITKHRNDLAELVRAEMEDRIEEAAAIMEYEGHAPRAAAEAAARAMVMQMPVCELDRNFYLSACGHFMETEFFPAWREAA